MIFKALLLLSLLTAAAFPHGEAAVYNATDLILFNCGSSSDEKDGSGRNWNAEDRRLVSENSSNVSLSARATVQDSTVEQVPYMTARVFRSDFTYSFPVSHGWKFLRLYFYPANYGSDLDAVNSFFAVTVNGFDLMKNFSAHLTATGSTPSSKTLIKEFIIPVFDDQIMNLTFKPSPNSFAFVNGVGIVSMPDRLYTKGGYDDVITNVDSPGIDFEISNTTAFETIVRINVGGPALSAVNDTGMFRPWVSDDPDYLGTARGITPNRPDVQIKYTDKTPAYIAPEDVYNTYRTMGNPKNPGINSNFNLTWRINVDVGFRYLVRLHFCETLREVTEPGERVFKIFIANREATEADVINWSGGSMIPVYKDFTTVMASNGGEKRLYLQIDLHPERQVYNDAILNGVEILKMNNIEGSLAGPNPDPASSSVPDDGEATRTGRGNRRSHVVPIILGVVGGVLGLMTIMVVAVLLLRRKKKTMYLNSTDTPSKPNDSWGPPVSYSTTSTTTKSSSTLPTDLCRRFSIAEIKSATDNFDEKLILGVGGFGNVFKGRIDGGSTIVAVKRLTTTSNQGVKEFETELEMLSKLRHTHLVSLIGFCDDENEMVLVYEYMPRGTLRDHFHNKDKNIDEPPLTWKKRLEICIGAARGLQYLHTGARHPIIHRDIKSTNILIDENYIAKVSDFGLSKVGPTSMSQTHVTTVVKGSFGYLDPEYCRRQVLTEKSDVYSFGVVLLEVLCGRSVRVVGLDPNQENLTRWVKSNYAKGKIDQIIDPNLTSEITRVSLDKFCEIAIRCVQDHGAERPTMSDVVWALEFALKLHETEMKQQRESVVDSLGMMKAEQTNCHSPRGEMSTSYEGESLFSKTSGDDDYPTSGSASSFGVFSEIKAPKGR